ncbi:hypothetical protein H7849_12210 [Alloacidobacterium dinghuense]|uniref:Lipocalin-like domain-containing protein n=1 Tax=Alloacidobacterium dinghuense TaxID=2763107 RepID=A0A7G8BPW6_9BACT|nr:hypothetical protein [Alloacidobacterium dinghuense]QNI34586.1 hypothetical protein H7849_12210 [Alloacidobacterium dinghuense]
MSKRTFELLLTVFLLTSTLWAADDPFTGKWKLNPSRSKLTDQMKVEALGANRYALNFSGDNVETVVADGTDQPGLFGTTLSVTIDSPNSWKVVRKTDGRIIIIGIWKLSEDGNTLTDNFTGYRANGSTVNLHYIYKRTAGTPGFPGTWESTTEQVDSTYEIQIQPYQQDGLSFINPGDIKSIKFDGKEYPSSGSSAVPGSTTSGQRINDQTLKVTEKIKDKLMDTQQIELSPDHNTLTMTIYDPGRSKPNILVFERE